MRILFGISGRAKCLLCPFEFETYFWNIAIWGYGVIFLAAGISPGRRFPQKHLDVNRSKGLSPWRNWLAKVSLILICKISWTSKSCDAAYSLRHCAVASSLLICMICEETNEATSRRYGAVLLHYCHSSLLGLAWYPLSQAQQWLMGKSTVYELDLQGHGFCWLQAG